MPGRLPGILRFKPVLASCRSNRSHRKADKTALINFDHNLAVRQMSNNRPLHKYTTSQRYRSQHLSSPQKHLSHNLKLGVNPKKAN